MQESHGVAQDVIIHPGVELREGFQIGLAFLEFRLHFCGELRLLGLHLLDIDDRIADGSQARQVPVRMFPSRARFLAGNRLTIDVELASVRRVAGKDLLTITNTTARAYSRIFSRPTS